MGIHQTQAAGSEAGVARATPGRRIRGLDALRIVCAVWVFGYHTGAMLGWTLAADGNVVLGHSVFRSLVSDLFAGPPAVVVFFVISGLVVHYANVRSKVDLYTHYTRRFIRVGGPIVVLWLVLPYLVRDMTVTDLPVWSLWCELIYYALYPGLLWGVRRFGWGAVLGATFVASLGLAVSPGVGDGTFTARGVSVTWILALPIWLLGAWVAEHLHDQALRRRLDAGPVSIWWLRLGMAAAGSAMTLLMFHTPVSEQVTMVLYAVPAAVWVMAEVNHADTKPPLAWLEAQGAWSYSLYLVHPIAIVLVPRILPTAVLLNAPVVAWIVCLAMGVAMAWLFFKVVEQPCHHLARWVSKLDFAFLHSSRLS